MVRGLGRKEKKAQTNFYHTFLIGSKGCRREEVENGSDQIFGKESVCVYSLMAPEFYCQHSLVIL